MPENTYPSDLFPAMNALIDAMKQTIAENISKTLIEPNGPAYTAALFADTASKLVTAGYRESLYSTSEQLSAILERLAKMSVDMAGIEVDIQNFDKTTKTLQKVAPYMEELPSSADKWDVLQGFKKKLSFERVVLTIQVLLQIYSFIAGNTNNMAIEKMDTIISQNEQIIENQEPENEYRIQSNELLKQILDAIIDLSESCDHLEEGVQDNHDIVKDIQDAAIGADEFVGVADDEFEVPNNGVN